MTLGRFPVLTKEDKEPSPVVTYIYLIGADGALFRAKAAEHEELLFVKPSDAVTLTCAGKEILSVR